MQDPKLQKRRYLLRTNELRGLLQFEDLEKNDWKISASVSSNFEREVKRKSNTAFYLPHEKTPLRSIENNPAYNSFKSAHPQAIQNYNQHLLDHFGLERFDITFSDKTRGAPCTSESKSLYFIEDPITKDLRAQTKLSTFKIETPSSDIKDPAQLLFYFPGTVTFHRKYVNNQQGYYELETIEYSNAALRDLSLRKFKLTPKILDKKIEEALNEETDESKYNYFKLVATNLVNLPNTFTTKFPKNALDAFYLKHLKRILEFLTQTKLPIDEDFKNDIKKLTDIIPNLDQVLDKATYDKLTLFLDPAKKLIFWPLNITFTPDSPDLINSSNSRIKMLKGDKDSHGGTNEGNFILTGDPNAERLGYPIYADACALTFNGKKLRDVFSDEHFYKYLLEKSKTDLDLKKVLSDNEVTGFNNFKKLYASRSTSSLVTNYFLIYEFGEEKAEKIKKYYKQALRNPTQGSIVENLDTSTIGIPGDATYKNSFTSNFFVVDDKVYFSTLQQDIITQTMDDNKTLITIHGTSRAVYKFNEANSELISFEFSNAEFRDLTLNSNLNLNLNTIKNYHKKETVIEEFKSNFEGFKKNLNTSFIKNIKKHYENFSKSFQVRDKKDELQDDIRNHLMWIIATFQHKHPSEELATDLKKAHTKFINEFAEKLQSINGFAKPDIVSQVEDFFDIAFVKAAQVYTNQSILHIAQNGIDHIKEKMSAADIDKAYENIILAKTLKENSEKFYRQTNRNAFTKENAKTFYADNFIFPIRRTEPKLDIHRNKWDLPLKNIGMFFITLGTWGLLTIGKAIYAAVANIKYKYVDKIKKHVSYTLDSHTKSFKNAHHEAEETVRLNKLVDKLVDTFVLKK